MEFTDLLDVFSLGDGHKRFDEFCSLRLQV